MQPTATLSDFEFEGLPAGASADWITNTKSCIRRDDGIKYTIKRKWMPRHYSWTEHNILETLNRFALAFIPHLCWTFYSGEHRYIVTVSEPPFFWPHSSPVWRKSLGSFSWGYPHGSHQRKWPLGIASCGILCIGAGGSKRSKVNDMLNPRSRLLQYLVYILQT